MNAPPPAFPISASPSMFRPMRSCNCRSPQIIKELRPKSADWPGLILEVTEDQVVNDLKMANDVANELRGFNCSLAIDDFGAGYSSLARLRQLPFSELKIDRAYVTDCDSDKMNAGCSRPSSRWRIASG